MIRKKSLTFALCAPLFALATQSNDQCNLQFDTSSTNVAQEKIFATKKTLTDAEEVALTFGELSHYLDATVQFYTELHTFQKKHQNRIPEITCKFCPQRTLPCDELLVAKIQSKAIKNVIDTNAAAEKIRKKTLEIYQKMTLLIKSETEANIKKFMKKIANEEKIPCEGCKECNWLDNNGTDNLSPGTANNT